MNPRIGFEMSLLLGGQPCEKPILLVAGRHLFENRYCNGCQCTTRHENRTESALCLRCGVVKFPVKKTS